MDDTPKFKPEDLNPETLNQALQSLSNFFIPKYRLRVRETTLGEGGFGTVKLADLGSGTWVQWLETPTTVAVKELHTRKSEVEQLRSAFRLAREMKVWALCIHPNILEFTGYYLSKDFSVAYLVSPYMKNGNIKDYLAREAPPSSRRLELVLDTIKGLAYLHSRNPPIVHGDLKSLNVLINDKGNALISDFGLARLMEDEPSGLSTSRGFKGTIRYCSPEVLLEPSRKPSSDIWSWGCLALEMLTDKSPYHECRREARLMLLICGPEGTRTLPEPSDSSSMPLWMTEFLRKCWRFEPHHRPNAEQCVVEVFNRVVQLSPRRLQFGHHLHPVHYVASPRDPPPAYPAHHLNALFDDVVYGYGNIGNTGGAVAVLPVHLPPPYIYDAANADGNDQPL